MEDRDLEAGTGALSIQVCVGRPGAAGGGREGAAPGGCVWPWFAPSRWVRVWTHLRRRNLITQPRKRRMESVNSQGVVGLGAQARRGLSYLDLFGVKGHDEAEEEEGGNADDAFNQEQVERPLLGGIGKGVRSRVFAPQYPLPSSQTPSLLSSQFPSLLSFQPLTQFLLMCQFWGGLKTIWSQGRVPSSFPT